MDARESMFESPLFKDINTILPVIAPGGSDSADFDQALEMLFLTGRSLPHAMMMMIPEPWSCLLYTSPSPRDRSLSRMPSSA